MTTTPGDSTILENEQQAQNDSSDAAEDIISKRNFAKIIAPINNTGAKRKI
jgi:hypothetical protein